MAAAAGLATVGCAGPRNDPPHVVCVLIDQLRKDSFDAWATTTRSLATRGVVFHRMRSVSPWTYPSVVSMMSGLFPHQHGANGLAKSNDLATFSPDVPLVHRTLQAAGWSTAAFVTNPFLREWNPFHVGFDSFYADFVTNTGNVRPDFRAFGRPDRMFAGSVNETVRRHFDARPVSSPEFTYVHYIDAHGPWEGAPFSPDYESAVRFVDARIAELHAYFRRRYGERVLFVVTSDHGRALGDDVLVGDGPRMRSMKESLHDFNVRIPFVVLPGEGVASGREVDLSCSNVDVAPTILELAGIAPAVELAGRSLARHVRGDRGADRDTERPVYLTMSAFGRCSDALVWRGRKYMRFLDCVSGAAKERRVFDLEADPRETVPTDDPFEEAEQLLLAVENGAGPRYPSRSEPMGPQLEESLRALGYVR